MNDRPFPPYRRAAAALVAALLIGTVPVPRADAAGIPVIDGTQIAQSTAEHIKELLNFVEQLAQDIKANSQLLQTFHQLVKTYQMQKERLEEQIAAIKSIRDFPDLLALELEGCFPDDWAGLISILDDKSYGPQHREVGKAFETLTKKYELIKPEDLFNTGEQLTPQAEAYKDYRDATFAVLASSEVAYKKTTERFAAYKKYLEASKKTQDLKASTDLNTRVAIENGKLLNELLQLHAITMRGAGAERIGELAERTATARFGGIGVK